ncbi:MAG: glycosyltransferase [Acutalibacteraceae bacterium]|nr:glycosyltransferase [Acutalibacteraceae bacterium]
MKIVQINATCGVGSTGKICVAISELLDEQKIENYIFYTQGTSQYKNGVKYADKKYIKLQALKSRVFGNYGFNGKKATKKLIAHLKQIKPDIVHLHNLHSHNCDLELLFEYFKSTKTKLFWTFHDCWAFTGYCTYFDMVNCDKWQIECKKCPKAKQSSWFLDRSTTLFNKKKQLFEGLDLTIITPSQWLADLVKQSFLREYPVKVINNGIDLKLFKLTESDFREKYNLLDKYVLLGVAFDWGARKGLDVFIELSKRLGEEYRIVLVGTNDNIDKQLPENIISIHRTQSQTELAEIYTAADLFVNPTREENFPTVNMEALACGTPVLTFKTGGSPEIIDDTCGAVVPKNDIDGLCSEILRIKSEKPYSPAACIEKAKSFNAEEKFKEYLRLYK